MCFAGMPFAKKRPQNNTAPATQRSFGMSLGAINRLCSDTGRGPGARMILAP